MKTALIISGLPRCMNKGYLNIQNCLIQPNNPDIFIHTWGNPNDEALRSTINAYFHPNMLTIEHPKVIHNTHWNLDRMMASHGRSYQRNKFVEMVYSMWYSMLQSNLLKEHNRLEHNIHYDYVIRARFDITYTRVVKVSEFDPNVIHIANRGLPAEMVDDRFAFASNELMNLYCSGFNLIEWVFSKRDKLDGIFCGETICYEIFKLFNIPYEAVPGLDANHLNHG